MDAHKANEFSKEVRDLENCLGPDRTIKTLYFDVSLPMIPDSVRVGYPIGGAQQSVIGTHR